MVRCHESDRGKNLLLLEKCEGQLMILREEMKRFENYPRGSVVTKATRREYRSKTKGIRKYANFYDNIDITAACEQTGKTLAKGGAAGKVRGI